MASSYRHERTAARSKGVNGLAALLACSMLSPSGISQGAPSYSITLQGYTQTSGSPLQGDYHTATPGVAPTLIDEDAFALPGHVGARVQLRTAWPFEIVAGVSGNTVGKASTDDFVISGPPGAMTVGGAIHFHVKIRLDRVGGLPGNDMHIAKALLQVTAATLVAEGSCWSGNQTEGADGVLTGQTPPDVEASFSVPGSFPVGEPFGVSMNLDARAQTWGDSAVSPGSTLADGWTIGLSLGDENGQVMELPAGYTVEAPSWNVNANRVGVPATDALEMAFIGVTPNPSVGLTSLGFSLPRVGHAILAVTDLEGRAVRRLVEGPMNEGRHDAIWEGRDDSGKRVAPGVYFAVLRFENRTITHRIVRIR